MSTKKIEKATIEIGKTKRVIDCDVVIVAAGVGSIDAMSRCDPNAHLCDLNNNQNQNDKLWLDPTTLVEATNPFREDGVYQFVQPKDENLPDRFSAIATDRGKVILAGGLGTHLTGNLDTQMGEVRRTINTFLLSAEIIETLGCNRAKFSRKGRIGNTRVPDIVPATALGGTVENLLFVYPAKMSLFFRCGEMAMQSLTEICGKKGKVLIIGGGVAGVEIARRAAQAGYTTTLIESKNRLFMGQSSRLGNQGRLWRIFGIARGETTATVLNHIEEAQKLAHNVPEAVRQNVRCRYWVHKESDRNFFEQRLNEAAHAAGKNGIQVKWSRSENPTTLTSLSTLPSNDYIEYDFGTDGNGDGAVDAEGIRDWLLHQMDNVTIYYNSELVSVS